MCSLTIECVLLHTQVLDTVVTTTMYHVPRTPPTHTQAQWQTPLVRHLLNEVALTIECVLLL